MQTFIMGRHLVYLVLDEHTNEGQVVENPGEVLQLIMPHVAARIKAVGVPTNDLVEHAVISCYMEEFHKGDYNMADGPTLAGVDGEAQMQMIVHREKFCDLHEIVFMAKDAPSTRWLSYTPQHLEGLLALGKTENLKGKLESTFLR